MQAEWTPAAGELVQHKDGPWLVLSNGDADALLNGNFGPQSREEVRAEYTLLLPACNSMAEAWDELKVLCGIDPAGEATYPTILCSLDLETGKVKIPGPGPWLAPEYQTYIASTCMAKVTEKTYPAHMRDMQKFGALLDWLDGVRKREAK